jgi:hypothetical protein
MLSAILSAPKFLLVSLTSAAKAPSLPKRKRCNIEVETKNIDGNQIKK